MPGSSAVGFADLPSPISSEWAKGKFFAFTPDELSDMARRCELRWQLPPFGSSPLSPEDGDALGLTEEERADYQQAIDASEGSFGPAVRALYLEATGDETGAASLDLATEIGVIRSRADRRDAQAVQRRLAEERAGERNAAEPGSGSIYERLMRLELGSGERFEGALASALGPSLARELRAARGARFTLTGCDGHGLFRSERIGEDR